MFRKLFSGAFFTTLLAVVAALIIDRKLIQKFI